MFKKVLIANRGEIAVRIARTCRDLGIEVVAVHSEEDENSQVVGLADHAICIGPAPAKRSYLNSAAIMEAAAQTGVDAIHPGYGFLSEDPDFAEICETNNLAFVGPSGSVMSRLADKSEARYLMQRAGIPILPGSISPLSDANECGSLADRIGYPVILKAAAGGGGRGMRIVRSRDELDAAYEETMGIAESIFGDGRLYVERYLERARHIEVQVLCDHYGNAIHLGDRDCSVQRRHQKLIEESPAGGLAANTRRGIREAAVQGAVAVGYRGVGTAEFLVDEYGEFYFMEFNCRLQVEHPVTECITGIDLVHEQLNVASGAPLSIRQDEVVEWGAGIECRIVAEDPLRDFAPTPGILTEFHQPGGPFIRIDTDAIHGTRVSPAYDPLIAKTIAWGPDRRSAIARMLRALREFRIAGPGVCTNREFLLRILAEPAFLACAHTTGIISQLDT